MFVQKLVTKKELNLALLSPGQGNPLVTGGSSQRTSNAEGVSMSWCHLVEHSLYNTWTNICDGTKFAILMFVLKYALTHLSLVPHICVGEVGHHWFRQWLVACSAPSHYLNQCWLIVNWTPGNTSQWNLILRSFSFEKIHLKSEGGGGGGAELIMLNVLCTCCPPHLSSQRLWLGDCSSIYTLHLENRCCFPTTLHKLTNETCMFLLLC